MIAFTGIRGGTAAAVSGQSESDCGVGEDGGRAGLARLWGLPCGAVAMIDFNANEEVTAVALKCDSPGTDWEEIGFDRDGGQFSQVQRGVNRYDQTISLTIAGQSSYNRRQINRLTASPCWHFIALDEGGTYHYLGAHTYQQRGVTTWESAGMAATGNAAQSGQGVTEGGKLFQLTLTARGVHQLAPHAIGGPDSLSVPCSDNEACGPLGLQALSGDCLLAFDGTILERLN